MKEIARKLLYEIKESLHYNAVTAILGARQVGKTTLAKSLIKESGEGVYLDLEKPSDQAKLSDPEAYFDLYKDKLICLDEIQRVPELFPTIRSIVDESQNKFLVLGSASPQLLRQTSETLAGRIAYFELTPFLLVELNKLVSLEVYQLRGGFPKSILAPSDRLAFNWLKNFQLTFLERDLPNLGFNTPSETLHRLWKMLAHLNGQQLNYSQIGKSLGTSHTTARNYVDILSQTFMIRLLQPYSINLKKRLVKQPKIYIRDTGILHSLLNISTYEELYSHPIYGSSWEVMVIENVIRKYKDYEYFYYRTSGGTEVDLILKKASDIIVLEIKTSLNPKVSKGFWNAIDDVKANKAYIIAPVKEKYPFKNGVWVYPLDVFINEKVPFTSMSNKEQPE